MLLGVKAPALIRELDRALPGFGEYCVSPDNLFDTDSLCGVFAACSHFVRDRPVSNASWRHVAQVVNQIATTSDKAATEAAFACFLENLAAMSHPLKAFLRGEALRYWNAWESAG